MTAAACLWLGLFPLLQRGTYAHITRDKWLFMLLLAGVTGLCFLWDLLRNRKESRLPFRSSVPAVPLLLAGALLLWTVLSCLLSPYGAEYWWVAGDARYEGLASQLCYFALFFLFCVSRVRLRPVVFSAAAGLAVFFAVVCLQRAGQNPLGLYPSFPETHSYALNPEFQGTIGNVDMDTGYLCLLAGLFLYELPALFRDARTSARKAAFLPAAAVLAALLVTLYLILTMGVQFGFITLAVLLLLTLLRFVPKKWRLPLLILLLALVLLLVWFWPGQSGGIWELHEILHGRARLSFGSNRTGVWLYSLRLAMERPFTGGGSGTFRARFSRYLTEHALTIPTEQDGVPLPDTFDTPHNEYVAQLTDHGFPALLLLAALLFAALFRRRERCCPLLSPCSAAVFCYAVQAFFSFSVCLVAPMFWVVLGLSFRED